MAVMRLSMQTRNALADAFAAVLDAAGEAATLTIYTGPQPANANAPVDRQEVLGKLGFQFPAAPGADNGAVSFHQLAEETSAAATGKAAWARVTDSEGNPVFDCDVTAIRGGGMIELNTTDIVEGGPIRINSFVVSFPAG